MTQRERSEDRPDLLAVLRPLPPHPLAPPLHVFFRQPRHLAFPDHVQNLVALNRPLGSIDRLLSKNISRHFKTFKLYGAVGL